MKQERQSQEMPDKLMQSIKQGIKRARRNKRYGDLKKLNRMIAIVKEQTS